MSREFTPTQKASFNSTLITIATLLTILAFIRPTIVLSSDLEPLKTQQALNTTSINNVERILTEREVRMIAKEIATMEYNQTHPTDADPWTLRESQDLSGLKTDLKILETRLIELSVAKRGSP